MTEAGNDSIMLQAIIQNKPDDFYRQILNQIRDIILIMDNTGNIIDVNMVALDTYGYNREEMETMHVRALRSLHTQHSLHEQMQLAIQQGIIFETLHRRRDGSEFPVEVSWYSIPLTSGSVLCSIVRDISHCASVEEELQKEDLIVQQQNQLIQEQADIFYSLFSNMTEGVALHELLFNEQGEIYDYKIVNVNASFEVILGLQRQNIIGKLATVVYATKKAPYLEEYSQVVRTKTSLLMETYFAPMDKYFKISVTPWGKDGFATIFSDISELLHMQNALKAKNKELEVLAATDTLTGAWNRRYFEKAAVAEIEKYGKQGGGLLLIIFDIDRLKLINNQFGHQAGDRVLVEVTRRIRKSLLPGQTLARWGGDEFVVLLPNLLREEAISTAEFIRSLIGGQSFVQVGTVTLSMGIADLRTGGETLDAWFKRADDALYQAKECGRNRLCCAQ